MRWYFLISQEEEKLSALLVQMSHQSKTRVNPGMPALWVTRRARSARLSTGCRALTSPTQLFFPSAYGERRCQETGETVQAGDPCTDLIPRLKVVQNHHGSVQLHTPDATEDKATNLTQDAPGSKGALCHWPL